MDKFIKILRKIGFILLLFVLFVNLTFPFYWAINSSLKTESQLAMTPATFIPRDLNNNSISITFENYKKVFRNSDFLRGIVNSFIVAVSTTLLGLIFASFGAFALGKLRFAGKNIILYTVLSLTMFPQISVLSGLYGIMRNLSMSALYLMILVYLIFILPFTMWVLTNFFKSLPNELLEAARVDGALYFNLFIGYYSQITTPALLTTGLLAFISAWNEYLFALTFTAIDKKSRTVPVAMALFSGESQYNYPFGQIMAAAVVVTIPLLILVIIFQRRIVDGLTAGAVKE